MEQITSFLILGITIIFLIYIFRPPITYKHKKQIGIPFAQAIYMDKKGAKMLIDNEIGLRGKPDMIFKTWILKRYIPLELKSGYSKEPYPHQGDLYQLVAYFILIERLYGRKPPYGKLVYANKTFKIRNTLKYRREVFAIMNQMRDMLEKDINITIKPNYAKCRNCNCKDTVCKWIK